MIQKIYLHQFEVNGMEQVLKHYSIFGTMTIRNAEEKDLPLILEIMNEAIENTTAIYDYYPRNNDYVKTWFAQKQSDSLPVLVCELNNQAVAYGTYGSFRERTAYKFSIEHSIYVHKNFQGKGIGKVLMKSLISAATEGGYHTMIAGIDASNEKSCAFHRQFGFEEVGRIKEVGFKFDRWLDLVFMQLLL